MTPQAPWGQPFSPPHVSVSGVRQHRAYSLDQGTIVHSIEIITRYSSTGCCWNTNQVLGQSGSSTSAAHFAARRLADKLFGPFLLAVTWLRLDEGTTTEHWQVQAQGEPKAWCMVDGEIGVGVQAPEGAIEIASGAYQPLVDALAVVARPAAFNRARLFIPDIVDERVPAQRADALAAFLAACNTPPSRFKGVRFATHKPAGAA